MYCDKCGSYIEDSARFCDNCGAPVEPGKEQEPQKQKKPMSKKTKLIIIFGAVGAAAVAAFLIVLFTVILPKSEEESRVDLGKYLTVSFTEADNGGEAFSPVDGEISGTVEWDHKKLAKDRDISEEKAKEALDEIDDYLVMTVSLDGKELRGQSFSDAGKDTVLSVNIRWMNEGDIIKMGREYVGEDEADYEKYVTEAVEKIEDKYGIKFEHDDMTGEINVGEELEKQNIKLLERTELNVLDYVREKELVGQKGYRSGDMSVYVYQFEAEINGYTVKKEYEFSNELVHVTDADGKEVLSFRFTYSMVEGLNDGDKVIVSYDESSIESKSGDKSFALTGDSIEYTVKAPESLNRDNVKNYAEALKLFFTQKARDDDADEGDVFELKNIYYSCDGYYYGDEYVVFSFYNATKKYYNSIRFKNTQVYIEDGAVHFTPQGYFESSSQDKSLDEFLKHFHEIDESKHTVIKVM